MYATVMRILRDSLAKVGVPQRVIYKHSAGGVVIDNNRVLLIHWDPPRSSYDFPKGAINKGETAEQACLREVKEETGYDAVVVRFVGQTYYEYDWNDGSRHKKTVDYFLLRLYSPHQNPYPTRERHETFVNAWVPVQRAQKLLTRDIDKDILQQAYPF